jgi:hypothetical protein
MRQLVNSWVEARKHGSEITLGTVIRELNAECGICADYSRLSEWKKGRYTPAPQTISQMLYDTLPWALNKAGINVTEEQQTALDELLWNFTMKDGKRVIERS